MLEPVAGWHAGVCVAGECVLAAGDGIEALHHLEGHTPDLVVLDLGCLA